MSRRGTSWLVAAAWVVPAGLMTIQSYVMHRGRGDQLLPWFLHEGVPWGVWVVLTPAVMRAAARPDALRRSGVLRHVGLALTGIIAFSVINASLGYAVGLWSRGISLSHAIAMTFLDWLPLQPLAYAGLLATGVAIEGGRRRREAEVGRARLEAELAQAQLAALRAQLQPHFLFNTLNAAVTLARAGDSAATARVLMLLSDLLRHLLRADAPQEVPLDEEVRVLETYLEIQRVRFGDRLQIRWQVEEAALGALVPQLVLQPLVENALEHGIARRSQAGRLEIAAARDGDQLRLSVRDDGPGPAAGFSLGAAGGLGLRNTSARLRRLYGGAGRLHLEREEAGMTAAIVELPFREAADE